MIKVSVIIPVFNAEKYLKQCLDTVVNQTLKDIEIICVDDGSTDLSLEILHEYEKKDSRIKVLTQQNLYAGAARNRGLDVAHGQYLSFLDADDFFELNMLENAYEEAIKNKLDIIVFPCDRYLENEKKFSSANWTINQQLLPDDKVFSAQNIQKDIFKCFIGWAWDKLFSSDFIKTNNLRFQEGLRTTNDAYFVFCSIVRANRISYIQGTPLVHQRRIVESTLSTTREKSWGCFYEALSAIQKKLADWDYGS